MSDREEERKRRLKIAQNVMPVLVHRLGGAITLSQADFDEMERAYGVSYDHIAVQASKRETSTGLEIDLKLVRNPETIKAGSA